MRRVARRDLLKVAAATRRPRGSRRCSCAAEPAVLAGDHRMEAAGRGPARVPARDEPRGQVAQTLRGGGRLREAFCRLGAPTGIKRAGGPATTREGGHGGNGWRGRWRVVRVTE